MRDSTDDTDSQGSTGTGEHADIEQLVEQNRKLQERVEKLESKLGEITSGLDSDAGDQSGRADEAGETPTVLPSGGQTYKIIGETNADGGIGVLGHNTADSGTTYGVWGEVDSISGYGLYTPDDAKAQGDVEAGGLLRANADASSNLSYVRFRNDTGLTGPRLFHSNDPDYIAVRGAGYFDADMDIEVNRDGSKQRTAGPIAKASINADGTIGNSVNVTDVTRTGPNNNGYAIDIDSVDYSREEYATVVTSNEAYLTETGAIGTSPSSLVVYLEDGSGNSVEGDFQFVTYELPSGQVTTDNVDTSDADGPDSENPNTG